MNGCVIPNSPIAVDTWRIRNLPNNIHMFFLSHMHTDHTAGLSSSWKYPIFCSELSAVMLQDKFGIAPHLIRPLEANVTHVLPVDSDGNDYINVYLIDANHCPGSVMFIFEGYFGKILYTGDFRYTDDMLVDKPLDLFSNIDILYLDNTFCNPSCHFPNRETCSKKIKEIIDQHPEHEIKLCIHSLGKEDLLEDLALHFKTWIVVNPERMKTLKLIERKDVFTTNTSEGFIEVVGRHALSVRNMQNYNQRCQTLGIVASALYTGLKQNPYEDRKDVCVVPYSDHSSYHELCTFVSQVKPKRIIPIVKTNSDMSCFKQYLDTCPVRNPAKILQDTQKVILGQPSSSHNNLCKRKKITSLKRTRSFSKGVVFDSPLKKQCGVTGFQSDSANKENNTVEISNASVSSDSDVKIDEICDSQVSSIPNTPCSETESFQTCATNVEEDFQSVGDISDDDRIIQQTLEPTCRGTSHHLCYTLVMHENKRSEQTIHGGSDAYYLDSAKKIKRDQVSHASKVETQSKNKYILMQLAVNKFLNGDNTRIVADLKNCHEERISLQLAVNRFCS